MSGIPVVILCGGQNTRMRGATELKKELVEIGGRPILWHVMRIFSAFGFNQFVLTLGYEGQQIKRYFLEYEALSRDFTIRLGGSGNGPDIRYHGDVTHPAWSVSLRDTGAYTDKAGRIAQVADQLTAPHFFLTYGDGVGDIDLSALVAFHRTHGKLATVTAVQVASQYGILQADERGLTTAVEEKPRQEHWINAGFMLFDQPVLDILRNDGHSDLEKGLLPALADRGELMLYRHRGFWRSMDTYKESLLLEELWEKEQPWKVW